MRTRLHLKPGQKGTKQLLAQYGDRLVCMRYRYDAQRKKRFKTVELIVAEREWEPPPPRFAADAIVGVLVGFAEEELREQVKQAGGKWNRTCKVWEMRYDQVVALKLAACIVEEKASNTSRRDLNSRSDCIGAADGLSGGISEAPQVGSVIGGPQCHHLRALCSLPDTFASHCDIGS